MGRGCNLLALMLGIYFNSPSKEGFCDDIETGLQNWTHLAQKMGRIN